MFHTTAYGRIFSFPLSSLCIQILLCVVVNFVRYLIIRKYVRRPGIFSVCVCVVNITVYVFKSKTVNNIHRPTLNASQTSGFCRCRHWLPSHVLMPFTTDRTDPSIREKKYTNERLCLKVTWVWVSLCAFSSSSFHSCVIAPPHIWIVRYLIRFSREFIATDFECIQEKIEEKKSRPFDECKAKQKSKQ